MGLEDRDWYREEPSKAWRRQATSSSPARAGGRPRVLPGAWLAIVVTGLLVAAGLLWNPFTLTFPGRANEPKGPSTGPPPQTVPAPRSVEPKSKIVRLRTVPGLDKPVARVTRWHVRDRRFGNVIVYVPVGKTPREALTVELAARGYQVVSS